MRNINKVRNELLNKKQRLDQFKINQSLAAFTGVPYDNKIDVSKIILEIKELETEYEHVLNAKNFDWRIEILRDFIAPLSVSIIGTVTTAIIIFHFGLFIK